MKEMTSSQPRMRGTYLSANSGCHLNTKLATSVSMTSRAVSVGGDVSMALLIDTANELLGFLGWSWIDVAQQPVEGERIASHQVPRILDRP